jgi:phage portal protein BeeE
MSLWGNARVRMARWLLKAGSFPVVPSFVTGTFLQPTWKRLVRDGQKKNAAVYGCISALAFALPEPPIRVAADDSDDAADLPKHPLRALLQKPNPLMGEATLWSYTASYMALGGYTALYKVRDKTNRVIELWPYHAGQMVPIPGGDSWIRHWVYDIYGTGSSYPGGTAPNLQSGQEIPCEDVIMIGWPVPDPEQPWIPQPPLLASAREVDSDNEATRYLFALLKNDAVPRTTITTPADRYLNDDEVARMRQQWEDRYSGDDRGGVAILEGGTTVQRLGLDLEQLAFEALHRIPEKRICASFRTPPVVAGLGDDPTYANSAQAYERWTRSTLVPLWRIAGSALQAGFAGEGALDTSSVSVAFDLDEVAALQEDRNNRWSRYKDALAAGGITLNEYRGALGFQPAVDGDVYYMPPTVMVVPVDQIGALVDLKPNTPPPSPAALPAPIEEETPGGDAQPGEQPGEVEVFEPPFSSDKTVTPPVESKSKAHHLRLGKQLQRLRDGAVPQLARAIDGYFVDLADTVVGRFEKAARSAVETKRASEVEEASQLVLFDDEEALSLLLEKHIIDLLSMSWELWDAGLTGARVATDVVFEQSDPGVVAALERSAERVRGITEATREALQRVLSAGAEAGESTSDLAKRVRAVVEESYAGRGRTIARTELAYAQTDAALSRYDRAGVDRVVVLDGGSADSDEDCNALDGQIKSLAWAAENPLGHPNCTRCFAPYYD